jgi:hypothetical protein
MPRPKARGRDAAHAGGERRVERGDDLVAGRVDRHVVGPRGVDVGEGAAGRRLLEGERERAGRGLDPLVLRHDDRDLLARLGHGGPGEDEGCGEKGESAPGAASRNRRGPMNGSNARRGTFAVRLF